MRGMNGISGAKTFFGFLSRDLPIYPKSSADVGPHCFVECRVSPLTAMSCLPGLRRTYHDNPVIFDFERYILRCICTAAKLRFNI